LTVTETSHLSGFPRYAVGVLSPVAGSDTMPHGLYRLLGPDYIVISTSLSLQSFKSDDLDRAVAAIDKELGHLVSRGANIILQSGTPLALSLGPEGVEKLVARLSKQSGLPVLSSALNAVAAARAVKTRKLVVANKWNEEINRRLKDFFNHWDIDVIGGAADSQEPLAFQSADLRQSAELAYRLGRDALRRTPQADALFIGGGAWFVEPAADALEREFGKPVITHLNGAVRALLKEFSQWRPFPKGYGRVLEVE
jgi:maleate cis-trans isomerase